MSAPAPVAFDAQPLVGPVDRRAVQHWARSARLSGFSLNAGGIIAIIVVAVVGLPIVFVFLTVFVGIFGSLFSSIGEGSGLAALVGLIPVLLVIAAAVGIGFAAVWAMRRGRERSYRLAHFAGANGMGWVPQIADPALPGMIFGLGGSRAARDVVRGERPRFVEFANYQYTTGSGKNRTTHHWGYVAVKLDVPLPHIVLDATSNNGLFGSNLPLSLDKEQRLSLEGDFDRYFTLYCPEGYERDALYLFTPDIMARFIDNAAALDVEIVDDWLFLYARRQFSTLDPATWAWLFSVVRALLDKLAQWARWRDERLAAEAAAPPAAPAAPAMPGEVRAAPAMPFAAPAASLRPPPGVAAPGRRLKGGVPWVAIVVGSLIILFWLFGEFGLSVLGALFGR